MKYLPSRFGTFTLLLLLAGSAIGPLLYPVSPNTIDFSRALAPPGWPHPFGCNDLGQDMLARVLAGGRFSLAVGLCAMVIASLVGTLVGTLAGVGGGLLDVLLMRITDMFLSLPILPLLLLIIFLFREGVSRVWGAEQGVFVLVVLVIGGLTWMPVARLVRAGILVVREMDYVTAARTVGVPLPRLVWYHILPNVISPVIVAATLTASQAIVTESTLSFLGLGFPPDTPTWGRLLYESRDFLDIAPHMALFPGLAVFVTILSLHALGEGVQRMLDPRGAVRRR